MNKIYETNPTIDLKLATEKGYIVNDTLSNSYISIQNEYLKILATIISEYIDLNSIVKSFSKYNLKSLESDNNYLKIISNVNVEILSKESVDVLNSSDTEAKKKMVIDTLKDVIKANYYNGIDTKEGRISYYDLTYDNLKKYNSLVFKISLDKFSIDTSNWDEFSIAIDDYVEKLQKYIFDNIKRVFDCESEFVIAYIKDEKISINKK